MDEPNENKTPENEMPVNNKPGEAKPYWEANVAFIAGILAFLTPLAMLGLLWLGYREYESQTLLPVSFWTDYKWMVMKYSAIIFAVLVLAAYFIGNLGLVKVRDRRDSRKSLRRIKWGQRMGCLTFVVFVVASVFIIPFPSRLSSNIHSNDEGAVYDLQMLLAANGVYQRNKGSKGGGGMKASYCSKTSDLNGIPIKMGIFVKREHYPDPALCVDKDEIANKTGYLFLYTVLKEDSFGGSKRAVVSFMIFAWPESIGKTGTKFYVTNQTGRIYWREAAANVQFPLKAWPDEETLKSNWTPLKH